MISVFDPLLPRSQQPLQPSVQPGRPPLSPPTGHAPGVSSPPWAHSPATPTSPAAPSGRSHHGRRRPHRLAAAAGITLAAVAAGAAGGYVAARVSDDTPVSGSGAPVQAVPVAADSTSGAIDVAAVVAAVEPSTVS